VVKLKICVIAPFGLHEDRADAIRLRELFEEMAKRRHSIAYVGLGKASESIPLIRQYAIHMPRLPKAWWPIFSATSVVLALFLDAVYRFDLFYFADILTPFFGEVLLKNPFKKRIVLEVNGVFSEELLLASGHPSNRFVRKALSTFESHVLRNLSFCICVCNWLLREVINRGVTPNKVAIVPNGVNDIVFNPSVDPVSTIRDYGLEGCKIVTFVGQFTAQQDIPLLIQSAALVSGRTKDVKFLLIGDGPTRKEMQNLVKRLGLESNVMFIGRVAHDAVPKLLAASHVTVVPFTRSESVREMIPLKVLEYWAMAKPVVATQVGVAGIPEAQHMKNVLIVDEDRASMADGIIRVLEDGALATTLGERGREEVARRYTWQSIAEQTIETLKHVLPRAHQIKCGRE
jgi:glycosyltransferase involved in cell wall biosynthesis